MGIDNLQRLLINIERENGRKARKKVGNYLAQGYNPDMALNLAGVETNKVHLHTKKHQIKS